MLLVCFLAHVSLLPALKPADCPVTIVSFLADAIKESKSKGDAVVTVKAVQEFIAERDALRDVAMQRRLEKERATNERLLQEKDAALNLLRARVQKDELALQLKELELKCKEHEKNLYVKCFVSHLALVSDAVIGASFKVLKRQVDLVNGSLESQQCLIDQQEAVITSMEAELDDFHRRANQRNPARETIITRETIVELQNAERLRERAAQLACRRRKQVKHK